jgi:altronate dehydratase small subunit
MDQLAMSANDPRVIRLSPDDNIVAVTTLVEPGQTLTVDGQPIRVADRIPLGHKMAIARIAQGDKIRKYGAPIGSATQPIEPGQYVHTHNVKSDYLPTYTHDGKNPYIRET